MDVVIDEKRNVISEPAREVPITRRLDVIVVGGSPTGVSAAIASSRNGAETLLVERYGFLGGQMTAGLVCSPHYGIKKDRKATVLADMLEHSVKDAELKHSWNDVQEGRLADVALNPEIFKHVLLEEVEEAGVHLLLHSYFAETITEEGTVKGVIVENKAGRQALLAKVVVDATGDADVAARAGAPYETRPPNDRWGPDLLFLMNGVDIKKTLQYLRLRPDELLDSFPPELSLEELERRAQADGNVALIGFDALLREAIDKQDIAWDTGTAKKAEKGVAFYWLGKGMVMVWARGAPSLPPTDCLDPEAVTRIEVLSRKHAWIKSRFFKRYVPGFENAILIATPVHIGVRETRNLITEYPLDPEDVEASRRFEDTIVYAPRMGGIGLKHLIPNHLGKNPQLKKRIEGAENVGDLYIPYGTLIPKGVENLLVAGRAVAYSISYGAILGEVAGTAAALAAKLGVTPRELDVGQLRSKLISQGFSYALTPQTPDDKSG
jgi:hypothetical protein